MQELIHDAFQRIIVAARHFDEYTVFQLAIIAMLPVFLFNRILYETGVTALLPTPGSQETLAIVTPSCPTRRSRFVINVVFTRKLSQASQSIA